MIKSIGYLQYDVAFGDKNENFSRVLAVLEDPGRVDLLVLPELAFTGYDFLDKSEVAAHAEPLGNGPTSQFVSDIARKLNAVVVAGYPEAAGDKLYNSAMMATPVGDLFNYRKIHLFSRENDFFSPGDAPPKVYDTPVGKVGMMICFDWFFPEVARVLALQGARVIAHPSNLVLPYCQRAMYCRSVENHVYTITANRVGTEDRAGRNLTFTGASQVLDSAGQALISAETFGDALHVVECDLQVADQKQINPYNNLLADRRETLYSGLLDSRKDDE